MMATSVKQPDGTSATERLPLLLPEDVVAYLMSDCKLGCASRPCECLLVSLGFCFK